MDATANHLVIMVKYPQAGRVKTRLAAGLGMTGAAIWFRHQTRYLLRNLASDPRWTVTLAISPDRYARATAFWPDSNIRFTAQGNGDLGQRMARLFRQSDGGKMVLIGADIPGIRRQHIARAFAELGRNDAVFGPSRDGGFWLVGLKRGSQPVPAGLFENVRWSTEFALSDTLAGLKHLSIARLPVLSDVDTADDLKGCDPAPLALPMARRYPKRKGPNPQE